MEKSDAPPGVTSDHSGYYDRKHAYCTAIGNSQSQVIHREERVRGAHDGAVRAAEVRRLEDRVRGELPGTRRQLSQRGGHLRHSGAGP